MTHLMSNYAKAHKTRQFSKEYAALAADNGEVSNWDLASYEAWCEARYDYEKACIDFNDADDDLYRADVLNWIQIG